MRTPIPHGVKGVVRQRVQRLPEPTIRTLTFAAALGQAFDLAVLAASLDMDGATLLDHLEPALTAGLVVDNAGGTSRYRFAHGLVNETIHQDVGPAQRARTHHLIAQALDVHHGGSTGPHLLEVAGHWTRAVPAAAVAIGPVLAARGTLPSTLPLVALGLVAIVGVVAAIGATRNVRKLPLVPSLRSE